MRLTLLVVILLTCCFTALCDSTPALPSDPALDKPVTFALKGEAISDVVKLFTKQTGVRFKTSKEVSDQKVTIFVDEKPLKEVMEGITTLFQWQWHVSTDDKGTVYGLYDPYREERKESKRKCLEEAQKLLLSELARMAVNPEKTEAELDQPPADWQARLADNLGVINDPVAQEIVKNISVIIERENYPLRIPCLKAFNSLSPKFHQLMVEGHEICFDSESPEPEWKLSDDIVRQLDAAFREAENIAIETNRMLFESSNPPTPQPGLDEEFIVPPYSYTNKTLKGANIRFIARTTDSFIQSSAVICFRWADESGQDIRTVYRNVNLFSVLLKEEPVTEASRLPNKDDEEFSSTKISISMNDLEGENLPTAAPFGWEDDHGLSFVNKSDILSILHRKLGTQIISDHYSVYEVSMAVENWQGKEMSVKELMNSGLGAIRVNTDWGWDGKYLYTRWKNAGELDAAEIPNRLLRPWQAAVKRYGYLGIDGLAEIAALPEPQLRAICGHPAMFGFNDANLRVVSGEYKPFLKFYNTLTSNHRRKMSTDQLMTMELKSDELAELYKVMAKAHTLGFDYDGVKVGTYKDGLRTDKPMTDSSIHMPVSITLRSRENVPVYEYSITTENMFENGALSAGTFEDALAELRMRFPDATADCLSCKNRLRYEVIYYFDDQPRNIGFNIDIPLPEENRGRRN